MVTMYLRPSLSNSRSMPVMPDFQPPYTLLLIKIASPSSQSSLQPVAEESLLIGGDMRVYKAFHNVLGGEEILGLEQIRVLTFQHNRQLQTIQAIDPLCVKVADIVLDIAKHVTLAQCPHIAPLVRTA